MAHAFAGVEAVGQGGHVNRHTHEEAPSGATVYRKGKSEEVARGAREVRTLVSRANENVSYF
jgi:hypothetical protein